MLEFSTPLVNYRPSNLLTGSSTPPPLSPFLCVNKYTGTLSRAEGFSYSLEVLNEGLGINKLQFWV
jgi:hypothetical protein